MCSNILASKAPRFENHTVVDAADPSLQSLSKVSPMTLTHLTIDCFKHQGQYSSLCLLDHVRMINLLNHLFCGKEINGMRNTNMQYV